MNYSELRSVLLSKGEAIEDRSGNHIFFYIEVDGQEYRATKVSHGARGQIDARLASLIARQMRLTGGELKEFVACPLSREEWVERWRARGPAWRF